MNRRGRNPDDSKPSATALRRQQFQERLRTERAEPISPPRNRSIKERVEKPREQPRSERWSLLLEETRAANEAAKLSQAAEVRAAQFKMEARVDRQARVAERISEEQAIYTESLQRMEAEQEELRAAAGIEETLLARRGEAEARRQHEQALDAAILRKKELRQQAAAAKSEEETLIIRYKAEQRQKKTALPAKTEAVSREPLMPALTPTQAEAAVAEERRTARNEAIRKRNEDELRAAALLDQRKEQKRQAVAQAPIESEVLVKRSVPVERRALPVEPQPSLREKEERQKPSASLALAPRAISGGSTARAVSAAPAPESAAPAETAPLVQTLGNFIIDENGDAVILRGVTVRGLDTVAPQPGQTVPAALSLDAKNLATITDQWGANLVRLPFAGSTILNGNGNLAASDLLAALDLTVSAITGAGAYVLLALEATAGAAAADPSTLQVWETLTARYQAEPRVFYEAFSSASPIAGDLSAAFATVIATIRQQDSTSLIFVPGSATGLDVTAVPMRDSSGDPVPNLVYTIAVSVQNVPNPDVLSSVSAAYPVFASVWSDDGTDLGRHASRVADLFERCGIGWTAANWNSDPRLVMDAASGDFTPTIWGDVVLRAIKLTTPPLLEPADMPASLATVQAESPKLPRLSTSGNFIIDESGQAIALRGVTVVGLDTAVPASGQTLADALAIDTNNLALMTGIWGLNLVRLPFLAQTVLTGNGALPAGKILAGLDLTVTLISDAGAYVLLALQADPGASLPDASTQQALQTLAKRYKGETGILYEIFASTDQLATGWFQTALSLIGTIRTQNPSAVIFVNTGNGTNLTGLPLLLPTGDPMFNVVYTVNVSPQNSPGPDDGPLASFADLYPVLVSVWSDDAMNPSRVSPYTGDFFARHNIGFAAANWNADPRLVEDAVNHDFASTAWGLIAGRAATLPVRQILKPF